MFKKIISGLLLLILFFLVIYPQALAVRGSSCVIVLGFVGLAVFFYNGLFYDETLNILKCYLPFVICCLLTGTLIGFYDPYLFSYSRSQIAWLFTAFLAVYFFFKLFPKGTLNLFLFFIIGAITIQCIMSILRYYVPAVDAFCASFEVTTELSELKKMQTEGARLIGFGIAYFGAGLICGFALILIIYILAKRKNNLLYIILLSLAYVFIFYIGLFSARTTIVGVVSSLVLLILLMFFSKTTYKVQVYKFIAIGILFLSIGYTLAYLYFSDFSDWAFELLNNYEDSGELRTDSSDGIKNMFVLPNDINIWLFGRGDMWFWGTDVGYSRLLFYVGLPGTLMFLLYPYFMLKKCVGIDKDFYITLLVVIGYNLALNVKGLSDLNIFFYLIVFYFIFRKYYVQQAYLNYIGRIRSNKLRFAVQSTQTRRRI